MPIVAGTVLHGGAAHARIPDGARRVSARSTSAIALAMRRTVLGLGR